MPPLARYYIKTAFAYLAAALLVGVLMAGGRLLPLPVSAAALWPTYLHLLVVGWLTQLIFGVAFWLFPRPSRAQPYGRTGPAWAAYGLLNAGLLLRALTEPVPSGHPAWRWGLAAGAVLQWLAVVLFTLYIWNRVRTR